MAMRGTEMAGTSVGGHTNADFATVYSVGADLAVFAYNDDDVIFGQNNTEVMRIDTDGQVGIGTDSPDDALDVVGDIEATGQITGAYVCGQLYMDGTNEQNLTNDYVVIDSMTAIHTNGLITATDSNLTVTIAGMYLCDWQISAQLGANEAIEGAIFVDGSEQDHSESHASTPASGTDHVSMSGTCLLNLSASEVVDLRVKSLDAAADYDPDKAQLRLVRIN